MNAMQSLNDIVSKLDHVYDAVLSSEMDEALKQALREIIVEGEKANSYGYHMKTNKLIDGLVPFIQSDKPLSKEIVCDLFLSVLDATRDELNKRATTLLTKTRVKNILKNNIADNSTLPFEKNVEGWSIRCIYTPDSRWGDHYSQLRSTYGVGDYGALTGISKDMVVGIAYRWRTTWRNETEDQNLDFSRFLKSQEIDRICQRFGIVFEIAKDPFTPFMDQTCKAMGGYEAMLKSLKKQFENTPYSAEKLIGKICRIHIVHDDQDFGFELFVNQARSSSQDVASGLILGFGVNFHQITVEQWNSVRDLIVGAFKSLQSLREQETIPK